MENPVHIQQVAAMLTAVVRIRARLDELSRVIPDACGEVWNYARAAKLPRPGRHVAVYFDDEINIEVGVEVFQPFVGNDRVICSSTPAGMVATAAHIGPYNRLGETHDAIHKWCKQHSHELIRPCWEVYGHWNDDPAQLRTDVFYLLKQGQP
jgi:effector-binding domain-containing protein